MDLNDKTLKIGAGVICGAIVLRLAAGGLFQPLADFLRRPETMSALLYLETGRVARLYTPPEATESWNRESPPPVTEPEPLTFSPADLELVTVNAAREAPALEPLLLTPLDWELTGQEPTVLILHTHATESYTKAEGETYTESADYRTLDENHNMLSIGQALAEQLTRGGISVLHDRTLHDDPSYNGSYNASRETVEAYLAEYPSIRLVLDLHRDAADMEVGQLTTAALINDVQTAKLMMVVGSDGTGLSHPDWQKNLSLALKLQVLLEQEDPGICRDLGLRNSRYNQDLLSEMLLIEVGAAGDTREQALRAAEALGDAILKLAHGTA